MTVMVWTTLHATIHQTLRQRKLLAREQSLVLAFSAGQDSLCLLQILRDLQSKWDWRLAIAHCNHCWPPDADKNAAHVAQLAEAWHLEHYNFTAPQILKGEAEGRHWRYTVLAELAQREGFSAVVTAHTASDRAETLLLNLLRGSGMTGLQALTWQRPLVANVQLIRPLLQVTRQQTADFCHQLQLPVWNDGMNQDLAYRRNYLRLEVLPQLRAHINPQVDLALATTAEILQAETDYLDRQAQALLSTATLSCSDTNASWIAMLDRTVLQHSPLALQRRALRQWLAQTLHIQPSFIQVEKTLQLLQGSTGNRTDPLLANIVAEVQRSWLGLRHLEPPSP
jgi:tRNA(Ile)-lysidine synthase